MDQEHARLMLAHLGKQDIPSLYPTTSSYIRALGYDENLVALREAA